MLLIFFISHLFPSKNDLKTNESHRSAKKVKMIPFEKINDNESAIGHLLESQNERNASIIDAIDSKANQPEMDDYAAMPISEYGAAYLRGMGWDENRGIGRNNENK